MFRPHVSPHWVNWSCPVDPLLMGMAVVAMKKPCSVGLLGFASQSRDRVVD